MEGMVEYLQQENLSDEIFVLERQFWLKCQECITKRQESGREVHL